MESAAEPASVPQYFDLDSSAHMDSPIEPNVVGVIPTWISGSLYRNGNGVYKMGKDRWSHVFDGFAVLHRWSIDEGKVTFLASVLNSDEHEKCFKANCLIGNGLGSNFPDPSKSAFGRVFSKFAPPGKSDNTGINIIELGDRLFALSDGVLINEINPETLTVQLKHDLSKNLTFHVGTAHPVKDRDGSCVYFYGTNMIYSSAYNFIRIPIDNDQKDPFAGAEIVAKVASKWKTDISYTHSFGVTDNYFVHLEQPMTFNLPKVMTLGVKNKPLGDGIKIHPGQPISIIIVNKKTGKKLPVEYLAPHGFVFHFINCYEENDHVICDVVLFESGDILHAAYLEQINNKEYNATTLPHAEYIRYVLPLNLDGAECGTNLVNIPGSSASALLRVGKKEKIVDVIPETPFDGSYYFDLPTIHPSYTSIKHQYVYGSTAMILPQRRVMKFDLVNKSVVDWPCESTHIPGEPVFVPRPDATDEDDGVVLCPVLAETTQNSSYLVILDAATFKEIARASVPAEMKMSFTSHGFFGQNKKPLG